MAVGSAITTSVSKSAADATAAAAAKAAADAAAAAAAKAAAAEAAKAAAEAASKAAAEAAAKAAADSAASSAARAAADAAAKSGADAATKAAAEAAAKSAADAAAQSAATAAAKSAASDAATAASKGAAEDAAKAAAERAAKDAASEAAEQAGKETAESAATRAAKFVAENPGLVIGGLTALAMSGMAMSNYNARQGQKRGITLIEYSGSNKKGLRITYAPSVKFLAVDHVKVTGSKTTPSIDGEYTISKVISDTQIEIAATADVTVLAPGGEVEVQTTFIGQPGDTVGTAAANAAGGAVGAVLPAATGFLASFASALGIDPDMLKNIGIGLGVVCCILIVVFIAMQFL